MGSIVCLLIGGFKDELILWDLIKEWKIFIHIVIFKGIYKLRTRMIIFLPQWWQRKYLSIINITKQKIEQTWTHNLHKYFWHDLAFRIKYAKTSSKDLFLKWIVWQFFKLLVHNCWYSVVWMHLYGNTADHITILI